MDCKFTDFLQKTLFRRDAFVNLLGILIGEKGLPTAIGTIVSADQLHLIGTHFLVDFLKNT
jgi:hypothetical protein